MKIVDNKLCMTTRIEIGLAEMAYACGQRDAWDCQIARMAEHLRELLGEHEEADEKGKEV